MSNRESLAQYLEEMRDKDFDFPTFNCGLFAADWVQRATGIDYGFRLRGQSHTDAYRTVASYGGMEAMVTALLQREPIAPASAMRGDIVLATLDTDEGKERDTIGICEISKCFFPRHPRGLIALPRSVARLAWSIE